MTEKILKQGRLAKTGAEYRLALLDARHIDRILALEEKGFSALAENEKDFLFPRDRDFYARHFASGGKAIGVFCDGALIAQAIVVKPDAKTIPEWMSRMAPRTKPERVTYVQNVIVDPACRGNGLMAEMIDAWIALSCEAGRTKALAKVGTTNAASFSVFAKKDFLVTGIGSGLLPGTYVYNIAAPVKSSRRKALARAFNTAGGRKMETAALSDISRQKTLLAEGYHIKAVDHAAQHVDLRHKHK